MKIVNENTSEKIIDIDVKIIKAVGIMMTLAVVAAALLIDMSMIHKIAIVAIMGLIAYKNTDSNFIKSTMTEINNDMK